jgi:hypothetical protein
MAGKREKVYYPLFGFLKQTLQNNCLTDELIYQSANKGTALKDAIEQTLKGREITIPDGLFFTDKDGAKQNQIRIKWWEDPEKMTYRKISVEPLSNLSDRWVDLSVLKNRDFGHYWLKRQPALYRDNIYCLDYSVAKGGYLAAYRFDREIKLSEDKFIYV